MKIEAAKRLSATKQVKANDKVEYVPTPGAKKEKNKGWKADVPVVQSEASSPKDARKHFNERSLKAPRKYGDKPQGGQHTRPNKQVKSDAIEYVPTPGAKKEKPADWEADVPVVKSEAAVRLAATQKGKKAPAVKSVKPHKAKAPANPEPKRKKPTKASFEESAAIMAAAMRRSK